MCVYIYIYMYYILYIYIYRERERVCVCVVIPGSGAQVISCKHLRSSGLSPMAAHTLGSANMPAEPLKKEKKSDEKSTSFTIWGSWRV